MLRKNGDEHDWLINIYIFIYYIWYIYLILLLWLFYFIKQQNLNCLRIDIDFKSAHIIIIFNRDGRLYFSYFYSY